MRLGHILIVSFSAFPSQTKQGIILGNIIRALGPRFQADVLTIRERDMGYVQKIQKHRLLRVPVGGSYIERVESFQRALSRQLDGDEYDIIHFRSPWEGAILDKKKQYSDAKYVYEPTILPPEMATADLFQKFKEYEKISINLADLIIVTSQWSKDYLINLGVKKPIEVIYPSINVDTFDYDETIGLSSIDMVWVDNFHDLKKINFALSALSEVIKIYPDFSVALVGPIAEDLAGKVLDILNKNNLENNIKFFGPQDNDSLPLLISRAKLGLIPPLNQYYANIPSEDSLSIFEYMSCKTAVIAPDSPFIREISNNGDFITLYNNDDYTSLRDSILSAIKNSEITNNKVENSYNMVRLYFTSSAMRRKIILTYANLIPPKGISEYSEFNKDSKNNDFKSGEISWQGNKTSSTGVGSKIPTSLTQKTASNHNEETVNLDIEDIEFEASGSLLGISYHDRDTNPIQEQTDPYKPIDD